MPIVTRTTVTTTRSTAGFRSSTIPVWVIKLLTVVIALVVLLLVYMQEKAIRAGYSTTFIVIALTCGILLGWSIGSVLQQVFFIRTVEILVNVILTVLAILSLIVAVAFLLERSDWSRYESYRLMVGISICFLLQSIVCILMLSWAFYGNLIIVESR
uniref:MARVEL domain-containing protein n=1 Tax=Parascaris univalens TaxID=6257 RepID=A0A915CCS2_PARUN